MKYTYHRLREIYRHIGGEYRRDMEETWNKIPDTLHSWVYCINQ